MKKKKTFQRIVLYISLLVLAVIFLFPLVWMVVSSFKDDLQIFRDMTSIQAFLPPMPGEAEGGYLENYIVAFERADLFRYIINSLIYTGGIIVTGLFVNSLAGYALARFRIPFMGIWLGIIIATLIIPPESIFLPLYLLVFNLGWVNTFSGLIIPFIANAFAIFLFRQFFLDFPKELEEAARIDGCSQIGTFFRIIVPLSKPVFATVAIVLFINHWNDFLWPLVVASDESIRTIQIGLQYFMNQEPVEWGPMMAALTVATIPMLFVFGFLQRYYVQGLTHTGSKN
ncbi:carbohydrate ABC transporter permease [Salisediminibacterium halotolerans]|uniref:carbohydrate ABC transporter permease n=1 Tax=Salisediminibacterium halotolerans TaxID=517425 RepID=UPI000EAD41F1|nr:carbohydrate ABC transporter permease [Salisediminibacterium halotolerans]RLJ78275.1 carbohydrate ABC transporter membrane protein 2 (CUT1 family) [Actinophytocola xinjiangensis]RPE88386.1 carbohydrate ABC transporter membrane protein 2 (CUT1 family) [Salisediminibacterium halotolerans]TWG37252.1 carbohydrate ABC transporter membrane protein 2 (CUT1 family) [Salisediminibacterium halotolerans]GEL07731.1 sugar ABC transporter permease [Salisediminibacterium halotolerans]